MFVYATCRSWDSSSASVCFGDVSNDPSADVSCPASNCDSMRGYINYTLQNVRNVHNIFPHEAWTLTMFTCLSISFLFARISFWSRYAERSAACSCTRCTCRRIHLHSKCHITPDDRNILIALWILAFAEKTAAHNCESINTISDMRFEFDIAYMYAYEVAVVSMSWIIWILKTHWRPSTYRNRCAFDANISLISRWLCYQMIEVQVNRIIYLPQNNTVNICTPIISRTGAASLTNCLLKQSVEAARYIDTSSWDAFDAYSVRSSVIINVFFWVNWSCVCATII